MIAVSKPITLRKHAENGSKWWNRLARNNNFQDANCQSSVAMSKIRASRIVEGHSKPNLSLTRQKEVVFSLVSGCDSTPTTSWIAPLIAFWNLLGPRVVLLATDPPHRTYPVRRTPPSPVCCLTAFRRPEETQVENQC